MEVIAWAGRKTYLKELEELDIHTTDLLFGISLRMENPSDNHYYGSIRRVGRALADAKDRATVAQQMLAIISDDQLDLYNRILIYYLFRNYNYYIDQKAEKKR